MKQNKVLWAEKRMNHQIASAKDLSVLYYNLMLKTKKETTQRNPRTKTSQPKNSSKT